MHRAARRMLMTRRGGYGAGSSPGASMGGGGYGMGDEAGMPLALLPRGMPNPDAMGEVRPFRVPGQREINPIPNTPQVTGLAQPLPTQPWGGPNAGNQYGSPYVYGQNRLPEEYRPRTLDIPPLPQKSLWNRLFGGGGYNDGPGGSPLDSQGNAFAGGGYDSNGQPSVQDIVDQELQQAGASPALVRGFHYNINAESAWNPNMRHVDQPHFGGEAHYSHGLLQEGGDGWNGLNAYATKSGTNWQDPRAQIQYAVQNLKNSGTWDRLNSANNWQDAAAGLAKDYLRPANQYLQSRLNDIYGRKDFSNPSAAGQPYTQVAASGGGITPQTAPNSTTAGIPGVPSTANSTGLLGSLLGGQSGGANPMMAMAGNLMNQQVEAPKLATPQPVHPNINPQALQQQQALLQGILNPKFQGFTG